MINYVAKTPLKHSPNIVKMGFTRVFMNSLITANKRRLWAFELPSELGGSNGYPQCTLGAKNLKILLIFIRKNANLEMS